MSEQTTQVIRDRILLTEVISGLFQATSFQATSFQWKENNINATVRKACPIVSFLVFNEEKTNCVEWEVQYGPIAFYESCEEFYETEEGERLKAGTVHWYLGNCKTSGNCTQLAVYDRGLPSLVTKGDFEGLKTELMKYLG